MQSTRYNFAVRGKIIPYEFENFDLKFIVGVFKHHYCLEPPRLNFDVLVKIKSASFKAL
ncbi:hypothetical protein HMPREF9554_01744 [Treponema phagedenis F0421]|nr:hypothetical protein HMPREF9554_01744 [Treponema phagedenis F0421]